MYRRMNGKLLQKLPKRIVVAAALLLAIVILAGGSISGFARARREEDASYKYYTSIMVESGDTLWSIALENMTPEYERIEEYINEVRRLNHLCGDNICAGEYLILPRYHSYVPIQLLFVPN